MGSGVPNVPLGRYRVSATQVLNGVNQQLLLSSRQQKNEAPSVLADFTDDSHFTSYRGENEAQTRTPILASRAVGSPGERFAV